jgi:uncharacterized membrane protein/predicted DsbA family dithiol-disulfide isomerase
LSLAGLIVSVYLAASHYWVYTDINHRSFCAISNAINCDTVSESPYSIWWKIPVPIWGVFGYAGLMLLLIFSGLPSAGKKRVWTMSFALALAYSLFSLLLAAVSTFKIGSYCILCIVTYAINLLLLYLTWIVRRRFHAEPILPALRDDIRYLRQRGKVTLPLLLSVVSGILLTRMLIPTYWEFNPPPSPAALEQGLTAEGLPWVGAENAQATIVEFADYQCFQCRKMHFYLRELAARYPGKIRIVHRHYPMDHGFNFIVQEPFHVGSGKMALLAIHAETKGKFWEMNDLLYKMGGTGQDLDLMEIAGAAGIEAHELAAALEHPFYRDRLAVDIHHGMKLRILGTPSYIINGVVYQGNIPPDILSGILKRTDR